MDLTDASAAAPAPPPADPADATPPPSVAEVRAAARDDDAELHAALRAGDRRAALTWLMRRHGDPLYRWIRAMVRDAALADDVHQQVFVEAYRDLDRFEARASSRTWLWAIARHRCLDALKGERRRNAHLADDEAGADVADTSSPVGERLDHGRLTAALEDCLDELAPAVRTAVLLRYQEGFSFEDMARICREKAGTLGTRVARALPVLRRCVEQRTGGAA